ncbi:MAG: radical SAM protein, MSMEG_0568 family [Promethearchaeota archaeon CR_4]|nr:MAG: radical SAM protein, MSMEG_0568 family [Candidatus Lokiarchaeota archaeon CR_4]
MGDFVLFILMLPHKSPTPLEVKVALLYDGLQIPPPILTQLQAGGHIWNWGRKGGAGPAGGRYFKLVTPSSSQPVIINISLQSQRSQHAPLLVQKIEGVNWTIACQTETYCTLELLPVPRFHQQYIDGRPAAQYVLLHATDCLATTVNQRCIYWRGGQACQFCGIELSLDAGHTVEVKDSKHILQVLELALAEVPVTHLTLTIGTQADESRGIREYIPIVQNLKSAYPDLRIHTQFEPPARAEFIHQLRAAGCDSVGIHVEILDDAKRNEYCPGKGHLGWKDYIRAWRTAVEVYGVNQVDSFILIGLEPLSEEFFARIREMCTAGVVPYPVPVREIPGTAFVVPEVNLDQLVSAHRHIAKLMKEAGIEPGITTAGCVRCSACSAIGEAIIELES